MFSANVENGSMDTTIIMHNSNDNVPLSFRFIFLPPEFIFEPSLRAHLALMKSPLMNKDKISQNRFMKFKKIFKNGAFFSENSVYAANYDY